MQAFALFAQIDVMTQGGPLDSTQVLVFQAVERGYERQVRYLQAVLQFRVILFADRSQRSR